MERGRRLSEKPSEEETGHPIMPSYSNATGKEPGRWFSYRVTFILDRSGGFKRLKDMLSNAASNNISPKESMFSNAIPVVDGSTLPKYINRRNLNFEVLYMLECIITHGFLHDYNLNAEFMQLLANQKKETALSILHKFYQFKQRIYDPLSRLTSEIAKFQRGDGQEKAIPSYCVMMRKVVVTPSKMFILPPTIETSNRIIRQYKDHKEHFLRVQFTDENGILPSASENAHLSLFNRVIILWKRELE